ncbi:DUF411 domain-containing protein [Romeria aff. gracilis LEGE 07310]|uniref:DUF411 domain-containing protein n=1 Tax=Vasconcelosia minhoensis LEGE 07310 TaxID=915328 RepID=A0A8J7A745_9CYAN|nr:DUF411 domain-containing protein [Romeria gracilis]MBE9078107.1 DUF411 domain-containing protein [Romeria aff. gracilis LEGE 07310]
MNRRMFTAQFLTVGLAAAGVGLTGCTLAQGPEAETGEDGAQGVMTQELTVFRSPTCSCCGKWIEHMEAAGFQVQDEIAEDMTAVKQQYGVPANLASCHTTVADGYVIEGHIPAAYVQRLLTEKPDVAGIAVPGMPIGSPGMESGDYVEPYTVFSFTEDGNTETFVEHS